MSLQRSLALLVPIGCILGCGGPQAMVVATATQIVVNDGDNQSAFVGTQAATAPSAIVLDQSNNPQAGVEVTFAVMSGAGSITGPNQTTGLDGVAKVGSWTLGPTAGTNMLTATSEVLPGSSVTFTATGLAGSAPLLAVNDGDNQSVFVGAQVATAPSVIVLDQSNNPQVGVEVTFAVMSGAGSITGPIQTTGADGVARVGNWTLGSIPGTNTLTATSDGLTGSPVTFTATGLAPPVPPVVGEFYNSSEPGCDGSDPNMLYCDDFEAGFWYTQDCDNGGFTEEQKGWCGNIFANPITPPGAAVCGAAGANGTNCAAHGGLHTSVGGVNMAMHKFAGGPVTELWARWYYKAEAGYMWGAEKSTNFTKANGDITWFNVQFNCGTGSASSTATPYIQIINGSDICQSPNISGISLESGRWYFFEVHARLNSQGTVGDGLIEMWIDDCGTDGACTGSPTLRTQMTNVVFDRNQLGCTTTPCQVEVLWWENWANPASAGIPFYDQMVVSKVGPIGFMP